VCVCEREREREHFSFVLLYVVRVVRIFDFRLVTNETHNKWRPVERMPLSNRDACFWKRLYVPPPNVVTNVKGLYPFREGQLHSAE